MSGFSLARIGSGLLLYIATLPCQFSLKLYW